MEDGHPVYANVAEMLAARRAGASAQRTSLPSPHAHPHALASPPQSAPPAHAVLPYGAPFPQPAFRTPGPNGWYAPPPLAHTQQFAPQFVQPPYAPGFSLPPFQPMYAPQVPMYVPPSYPVPPYGPPPPVFNPPTAVPAVPEHHNRTQPMPSQARKRPRATAFDESAGATLFLSALPRRLSTEEALRSHLQESDGSIPVEIRLHSGRARGAQHAARAWVTYSDARTARAALPALRRAGLRARIHDGEPDAAPRAAFLRRVRSVAAAGGAANVLLLRTAPDALTIDELLTCLRELGAKPLRARSTLLPGSDTPRAARAFWLTYANSAACTAAFDALHARDLRLRCGAVYTLKPALHNDVSADAGDFARRKRHLALGHQPSAGEREGKPAPDPANASSRALAKFLVEKPELCLFIRPPLTH